MFPNVFRSIFAAVALLVTGSTYATQEVTLRVVGDSCTYIHASSDSSEVGEACISLSESNLLVTLNAVQTSGNVCILRELEFSEFPHLHQSDLQQYRMTSNTFEISVQELKRVVCGDFDGSWKEAERVRGRVTIECSDGNINFGDFQTSGFECQEIQNTEPSSSVQLTESTEFAEDEHYDLEDVNYPRERLTLEELNFCDLGWSGMTRVKDERFLRHLDCFDRKSGDFDPSCISCLGDKKVEYAEDVWRHYDDKSSQEQRTNLYRSWFDENNGCSEEDTMCKKVVVVVAADDKYLSLLRHWFCYASAHGLDKGQLVVYSYGESVTSWAKENNILSVVPEMYGMQQPNDINFTFKYSLFPLFLDLLKMGKHVIFNDVDIVWTGNLAAKLPVVWPDVDLASQLVPTDNYPGLNSGVLSLRPTNEVVVYVETLMSLIPLFTSQYGVKGDQIFWNHLLRHYAFRSLSYRPIPFRIVLRHSFRHLYSEGETLAIHIIGSNGGKGEKVQKVILGTPELEEMGEICLPELEDR